MNNKEFFSHDSDAFFDEKIVGLRADYGFESYGLWWFIIERMRKETDFKLDYNKKMFRSIKVLTGTTIDVEKFVNDCINEYELFILEDDKFYSKSFLNRMNLMIEKQQKKSEQAKIAGKKSAEVRKQKKADEINRNTTDVEQTLSENVTNVKQTLKNNATDVEHTLENSQRKPNRIQRNSTK